MKNEQIREAQKYYMTILKRFDENSTLDFARSEIIKKMKQDKTFQQLMNDYALYGKEEDLLLLAKMSTMSVLKTLQDPQRRTATEKDYTYESKRGYIVSESGENKAVIKARNGLKNDIHITENVLRAVSESLHYETNQDGDITIIDDGSGDRFFTVTLSDGMDLYHEAVVAILEEQKKQLQNGVSWFSLTEKYTTRKPSKKVYITEKPVFEDTEVTGIQNVYRHIRKYASDNRTLNVDARCKYMYLSEIITDEETETESEVYKRLPKELQIADVFDVHGNEKISSTASISEETVNTMDTIIEKLNLTNRQATVLKYRLRGYGVKAIANTLHVSKQAIQKTMKQIQAKAVIIGFIPDGFNSEETE